MYFVLDKGLCDFLEGNHLSFSYLQWEFFDIGVFLVSVYRWLRKLEIFIIRQYMWNITTSKWSTEIIAYEDFYIFNNYEITEFKGLRHSKIQKLNKAETKTNKIQ